MTVNHAPWKGALGVLAILIALLARAGASASAAAPPDPAAEAIRTLRRTLSGGNEGQIEQATSQVVQAGGTAAAEALLDIVRRLPEGQADRIYWILVHGLGSFQDRPALDAVGRFVSRNERAGASRDILFSMQHNTSPAAAAAVFGPVLAEGPSDLRAMAVDGLSGIRAPESVDALIAALRIEEDERPNGVLKQRILRALQVITGQTHGNVVNWEGWWERNRANGLAEAGGVESGHVGGSIARDGMRQEEFESLRELPEDAIVVVTGIHTEHANMDHALDHIERLLATMGIPHRTVNKTEINDPNWSFGNTRVLILNCQYWREHCICPNCRPGGSQQTRAFQCTGCDVHNPTTFRFTDEAVSRIRQFVDGGGYLFSEDWMIEDLVERSWPELVRAGQMLAERELPIQPARGATAHPYLRRIFSGTGEAGGGASADPSGGTQQRQGPTETPELFHTWKVDQDSPAIHVVDPRRVTPLMESSDLRVGQSQDDALAITFASGQGEPGPRVVPGTDRERTGGRSGSGSSGRSSAREFLPGGRVLHVLSHFGKQESSGDEFVLQNLLLNFLTEAMERFEAARAR